MPGALALLLACAAPVPAQELAPWWPHPIWGAGDQAGASNWITPEKIVEAVRLVRTGQLYELGQPYTADMPLGPGRVYTLTIPGLPTSGPIGSNRFVWNDDLLCTAIGQVGTQFDGLGHVGVRTTMADGTEKDVFYNGFVLEDFGDAYGLKALGVEKIRPILTRGILVDVAGYKGAEALPGGYEVSLADVRGALARQGIEEAGIRPGDALLFRYGWARFFGDPSTPRPPGRGAPGIGMEVARWVAERQAVMVGSDTGGTEVAPPAGDEAFPVHVELLVKHGILNIENLALDALAADRAWEFLFVFTPVPFVGATGSPGRPLAIR